MKQPNLQLCPSCMKRFDGDMCVRCERERGKRGFLVKATCFIFGHIGDCNIVNRNYMWGKPEGEPLFEYTCRRCGLKDTVELPYITTGNAESERWGVPLSKLGRRFSKKTMEKINGYDADYRGYHGRGFYHVETDKKKLAKLLSI